MTTFHKTVTFFVAFLIYFALAREYPEIKIEKGRIKGKTVETEEGTKYHSFTGIPYAKPPIHELRFQAPQPVRAWSTVLDATKPSNVCPQNNIFFKNYTVIGNEDCLYINVYTPQLPQEGSKLLPVMFYIHGGGWSTGHAGSGLLGPDYFMEKDVVIVTSNYRLGALGFATSGNDLIAGNGGLKDQAFAIKWTKNNIKHFGGDPNKITVFGQSAGGASAHYHMLSPLSRNLINGVIAQSGVALDSWALVPGHLVGRRTRVLAGFCGCDTYKLNNMFDCLMKLDAHELVKQSVNLLETDMDPMILFKPIIEPPYIEEPFLNEDPLDIIKSGKAANVPFMTGLTTDEGSMRTGSLYSQPTLLEKLDTNFQETAPLLLMYGESMLYKNKDMVNEKIRDYYFGKRKIDESTAPIFTRLFTDSIFLMGAETSVNLHSKYSKKPVYYYLFGYQGSESYCKFFGGRSREECGVCHCDELLYLFKSEDVFPNYEQTESDKKVRELLTTLWTNFAKEGNPTPETDSSIPKWEPSKGIENKKYYFINEKGEPSLAEGMYKERAHFWRELPVDSRRIKIRDEL